MNNEFAIKVNELKKSFKDKNALKGISFKIRKGEIFGFLGPNGAGKTTTIKILTGQLLQSYGDVEILSKDVIKQKKEIIQDIGIVPEKTNLYERLTIKDNLELFCKLYGVNTERIKEVLRAVNLENEEKKQVMKLSKGMKQRVLLARGLLHKPKLLLLDEPTSGLDPANAEGIYDALRELNEAGTTIFLTTHNMEEADKLCDRVAFLNSGEVVEIGSPDELKLKHTNNKIEVLLKNRSEKIFVENDDKGAEKIKEWMKNGELLSIHSCEPTLADIFMLLTGRGL